jgi:hypothetical protein
VSHDFLESHEQEATIEEAEPPILDILLYLVYTGQVMVDNLEDLRTSDREGRERKEEYVALDDYLSRRYSREEYASNEERMLENQVW